MRLSAPCQRTCHGKGSGRGLGAAPLKGGRQRSRHRRTLAGLHLHSSMEEVAGRRPSRSKGQGPAAQQPEAAARRCSLPPA